MGECGRRWSSQYCFLKAHEPPVDAHPCIFTHSVVFLHSCFRSGGRFLAPAERSVGPEFSCTVDGDGPGSARGLTFISWNVYGLADSSNGAINSKRRELERFLRQQASRVHLVLLQETWLQCDDEIHIPGYTWFGRNRANVDPGCPRGNGGVGVLVHDSIAPLARVISEPTYGGTEGVMWLRVDHGRRKQYDMFCLLYLEPQRPAFPVDHEAVFDGIQADWIRYSASAYNTFLVGDFNTRIGQLQETARGLGVRNGETIRADSKARRLVARLRVMKAAVLHGRLCPWRHTFAPSDARRPSVCDYVVSRDDRLGRVAECSIEDSTYLASDHRYLKVTLDYMYGTSAAVEPVVSHVRYRTSRLRDPAIRAQFCSLLGRELSGWACKYQSSSDGDISASHIESAWTDWRGALDRAATASIGKRKFRCGARAFRRAEPWWSAEIDQLLTHRRSCGANVRHCFDRSSPRFAMLRQAYCDAKRALKKACKKARRAYQDTRLTELESVQFEDPQAFAAGVADLACQRQRREIQAIRKPDGALTFNTTEIMEVFHSNYADLGRDVIPAGSTYDIQSRRSAASAVQQQRHRAMPRGDSPLNCVITADEVEKAISKQKDNACSPLDLIKNSMLTAGSVAVVESLVILLNLIFDSGHSPAQWQTGVMTLMPKDGDSTDWANYRGITLLSVVGKIFESILAERIFQHLEHSGQLPAEQGGFRRGFGCSDHIFILSETIKYRSRRHLKTYCAFLDIRKAFPTMHRSSMLAALARSGVDGKVWRLVDQMYSSTSTQISFRGALSTAYSVESGLREGSVLSPILYSVYINTLLDDFHRSAPDCGVDLSSSLRVRVLLYADDVVLIAGSASDLQRMLSVAERHADKMQYQFSVPTYDSSGSVAKSGKSQVVVFGERGLTSDTFNLHGVQLQQQCSYKYLGVHLHQLLGRSDATRDLCPQSYVGRLLFDDDHDEMRRIVRLRFDDAEDTWAAVTCLCSSDGNQLLSDGVEYWLTRESGIDSMISAASVLLQSDEARPTLPPGAWDTHVDHVVQKLRNKVFLLRRMQCVSGGFSPRVACGLVRSFASSSVNFASEIWNTTRGYSRLESEFAVLHQRVLGCQSNTSHKLMSAELGLLSQRGQRDVCSLLYLRRVLRMPQSRLTRRVFDAMSADRYVGSGDRANWSRSVAPALLKRYSLDWPGAGVGRARWRKLVVEAVTSCEADALTRSGAVAGPGSKAAEYVSFRSAPGMPRYLSQRRSWWMSYGRSVKTKLRCGANELEVECGRYDGTPRAQRLCRCCTSRSVECSFHFLMECPFHARLRADFFASVNLATRSFDPFHWRRMTAQQRWRFLLGDGPPVAHDAGTDQQWGFIETRLYNFLGLAYKARRAHLR